jgi:hypothetical protein
VPHSGGLVPPSLTLIVILFAVAANGLLLLDRCIHAV